LPTRRLIALLISVQTKSVEDLRKQPRFRQVRFRILAQHSTPPGQRNSILRVLKESIPDDFGGVVSHTREKELPGYSPERQPISVLVVAAKKRLCKVIVELPVNGNTFSRHVRQTQPGELPERQKPPAHQAVLCFLRIFPQRSLTEHPFDQKILGNLYQIALRLSPPVSYA
jgi:hypothetical protein